MVYNKEWEVITYRKQRKNLRGIEFGYYLNYFKNHSRITLVIPFFS